MQKTTYPSYSTKDFKSISMLQIEISIRRIENASSKSYTILTTNTLRGGDFHGAKTI